MTMQSAGSGAVSGAAAGTVIGGPGWGTAIGAGLGGLAGLMGGSAAGATGHDLKDLAKLNAKLQAEENAKNRAFAEHLLDISHPQMSGQALGDLLFSQGQNEATRQHDIDLGTTLRQNLRAGSPFSSTDIMGGFDRANAGQWQDKMASARLQGMLGVLPGASAINAAGGLGKGIAPTLNPDLMTAGTELSNYAPANTVASLGTSLQALIGAFGKQSAPGTSEQDLRNTSFR